MTSSILNYCNYLGYQRHRSKCLTNKALPPINGGQHAPHPHYTRTTPTLHPHHTHTNIITTFVTRHTPITHHTEYSHHATSAPHNTHTTPTVHTPYHTTLHPHHITQHVHHSTAPALQQWPQRTGHHDVLSRKPKRTAQDGDRWMENKIMFSRKLLKNTLEMHLLNDTFSTLRTSLSLSLSLFLSLFLS